VQSGDARIDTISADFVPQSQSGVIAHFGVTRYSAASIILNGPDGKAMPPDQDSGNSMVWGSIYSGTTPISISLVKPLTRTATASVTVYGQIASNQQTVPTVGNSRTLYSQNIAAQSSINYGFYLLIAPACTSLTASQGTFPLMVNATPWGRGAGRRGF
jgi:hypothetical protein